MSLPEDPFERLRPRLFGLAYRMLGVYGDAEDLLQEAHLRWLAAEPAEIASAEAWLVSVVSRMSIDRLRHLKVERAAYTGPWLPAPWVGAETDAFEKSAESQVAFYDDLSNAFLLMLERLTPEERAAFLLRQVFDHDYPDVARLLGKSEAACRQLVHRARQHVRQDRRRNEVSTAQHRHLLEKFAAAASSGEPEALAALLAEDAVMWGDGGGLVTSVNRLLHGPERIARLFHVIQRQHGDGMRLEAAMVNGRPGLLRWHGDKLDSTVAFDVEGERITAIYLVRNPQKLRHLSAGRFTKIIYSS